MVGVYLVLGGCLGYLCKIRIMIDVFFDVVFDFGLGIDFEDFVMMLCVLVELYEIDNEYFDFVVVCYVIVVMFKVVKCVWCKEICDVIVEVDKVVVVCIVIGVLDCIDDEMCGNDFVISVVDVLIVGEFLKLCNCYICK